MTHLASTPSLLMSWGDITLLLKRLHLVQLLGKLRNEQPVVGSQGMPLRYPM